MLLLTGATGQLGGYLQRKLIPDGRRAVGWASMRGQASRAKGQTDPVSSLTPEPSRLNPIPIQRVDLGSEKEVSTACRALRPTHIIHAGAVSSMGACAREPDHAFRVNTQGTRILAALAEELHARLLFISTDLVFDGVRGGYREVDPPAPMSVYGRTKVEAEKAVLSIPRSVVIRLSLLFGPSVIGRPSFFDEQVRCLLERKPITLFHDEWRTPLHLKVAARSILTVLDSAYEGIIHIGGPERMTREEMGLRLAEHLRVINPAIDRRGRESMPGEPRPRDTSLDSSLWTSVFPGQPWPLFEEALAMWRDEA
jgi:dTDP-4-dehydrorhamnose reductase